MEEKCYNVFDSSKSIKHER